MTDADLAVIDQPVEAEIVPISSPKAVMLSPRQLQAQMKRDKEMREIINQYIDENMVSGKDYGTIVIKGKESKPSLLKPGAEKFCGLFKTRPTFRKDNETLEMLGNVAGIIAYVCDLVDVRGQIVGEGRGTAKTDPKNGTDFDINKQVKIAEKRAQIDAVLRTGGLSDFFTQDMEDAPRESRGGYAQQNAPRPATQKQIDAIYNTMARMYQMDNKADMDAWLMENVGKTPEQMTTKLAGAIITRLFATEKSRKEEKPEKLDVVVTDVPDNITLDGIPY